MEQQRLRDGEIRRSVKGVRKSKHVIPGDRRKSGVGWEPGEVEVTAQDYMLLREEMREFALHIEEPTQKV